MVESNDNKQIKHFTRERPIEFPKETNVKPLKEKDKGEKEKKNERSS